MIEFRASVPCSLELCFPSSSAVGSDRYPAVHAPLTLFQRLSMLIIARRNALWRRDETGACHEALPRNGARRKRPCTACAVQLLLRRPRLLSIRILPRRSCCLYPA